MTVKEALETAGNKLKENNIDNHISEARYLLKYLLDKDDVFFITNLNYELKDEEIKEYEKLINKRRSHVPFSYITGIKEFMGLDFHVDKDTLIPRPETEIIVEYMIENFKDITMDILEIGVGSGCISISIAKYLENVNILGVDINEQAIITANKNIKEHNVQDRVKFKRSDIYENVEGKFDIIISNPPYIRKDIIDTLEDDVKKYEPILALDGGEDGLYFYREIIKNASKYLNQGGRIIFEIGHDQGEEVKELLLQNNFTDIETIKDLAGFDRTVVGRLK